MRKGIEAATFSLEIDRDPKYFFYGIATVLPIRVVREYVKEKGLVVPGEEELEYCLRNPLSEAAKPLRFRNWEARGIFFGAIENDEWVATTAWEPGHRTLRRSKLHLDDRNWDNARGKIMKLSTPSRVF